MRSSVLKVFYSNNLWERLDFAAALQNVDLLIFSPKSWVAQLTPGLPELGLVLPFCASHENEHHLHMLLLVMYKNLIDK